MSEPVDLCALLIIKAHSARVPGKNFRVLGDRPLFRWIVDLLLGMPEIDRVVIDTDARRELGALGLVESPRLHLRDRRPELRGDHVTANTLLADLLPAVPARVYLMTHVTNPFLTAATIRAALARFREAIARGEADALLSVNEHRARFFHANGDPLNHDPAALRPTQDLAPIYEENSNLYLFTAESFAKSGTRNGSRPLLFPTPKHESLDIDDLDDWQLAERIARGLGPDR
ncbi:MAG: acylneuraminate cytidylyltransferase family protein [Minicystis sp.]